MPPSTTLSSTVYGFFTPRSHLRSLAARHIRPSLRRQHNKTDPPTPTPTPTSSPSPSPPQPSSSTNTARSNATPSTQPPSPQPQPPSPSPSRSSIFQRMGPLTRAFDAYGRTHRKRPYTTQVVTAIVIFTAGDIVAQRIGDKEYDPVRTVRSAVIGAIAAIPQFKWFVFLTKNFNYSSRALSLATKILVSQLVLAPAFGTYFFSMQALLAGEGIATAWDRVCRGLPRSFANSWKVWPAVMAYNLAYVPLAYRSVVAGVASIGWQTYLSWLNRVAEVAEEELEKAKAKGGAQEEVNNKAVGNTLDPRSVVATAS